MYKIAFFDIDWTLYDHNKKQWVESSLEAIKKLQSRGVKCFVCTARDYESCKHFGLFSLGIHWDGGIYSAGSIAYSDRELIYSEKMNLNFVKRFLSFMNKNNYVVQLVGHKKTSYTNNRNNYFIREYRKIFIDQEPLTRKYDGKPVTCLQAFVPESMDELIKKEFPSIYFFRFFKYAIDVKGWDYSKGTGVEKVLRHYGLKREDALAFGDDIQDISVASAVGTFVAVGNARDEVKKASHCVCEAIWDNGIYNYLQKILN